MGEKSASCLEHIEVNETESASYLNITNGLNVTTQMQYTTRIE